MREETKEKSPESKHIKAWPRRLGLKHDLELPYTLRSVTVLQSLMWTERAHDN